MAYSTLADLKKTIPERELVQVTDDEGRSSINEARVNQAIQDADDLIDTFLRSKHTVPLATVPPTIRRFSCQIAIYYLFLRRMGFEPTDAMTASYKEAIRFLEGTRDGKNIIDDADSPATTGSIIKTNKTACDREYDSAKWATY